MRIFLFSILWLASLDALASPRDVQVALLAEYNGANEDLESKLKCLETRSYPGDIEICGISGFQDSTYQNKVEECLYSKKGNIVLLKKSKIMLVVQCLEMRVAVEFEKKKDKYLLVYIGELLD